MTDPTKRDPFNEGFEAFGRGAPRKDRPYPEGSDDGKNWEVGWDEAERLGEEGKQKKKDPFNEGFEAFERGALRLDCPYLEGSGESINWQNGWDEAQSVGIKKKRG